MANTDGFGIGILVYSFNKSAHQCLIESNGGLIQAPDGEITVDASEGVEVFAFWQALA